MFSALTSKIFGGVAIALLVLAGVQTYRVDSLKDKLAYSNAKLVISNTSIDTLEKAIIASNESIEKAKQASIESQKQVERLLKEARTDNKKLNDQIVRIVDSKVVPTGKCPTSEAVLNAEGL